MKVRGVRQHDITDCGAACLVYVAAWHGLHVSVMETAVLAQTDENGTTVYGMLKAAEKLGFESHAVRCDPDFLVQLTSPAIAHVLSVNGHTHYVAISAGKNGLIQVMDPANGRVSRIGIQQFTEYWTGVLILLSPGDGFRKNLPLPKWKPLKLAGARHYSSILMVLALAIVQSILAMAMPLFLKKVVDDVVQNGNAGELMMQGAALFLVSIFQYGLTVYRGKLVLAVSRNVDETLSTRLLECIIRLPRRITERLSNADFVSRLNDANKLSAGLSQLLVDVAINALSIAVSLILILWYDWRIGLISLILVPVYLWLYVRADRIHDEGKREIIQADLLVEEQLVQTASRLTLIRQLAAEEIALAKLKSAYAQWLTVTHRYFHKQLRLFAAHDLVSKFFLVGMINVCAWLAIRGQLSSGEMVSIFSVTISLSASAVSIMSAGIGMRELLISAERYCDLVTLPMKSENQKHAAGRLPDGYSVTTRNLSFSYKDDIPVITALNATFPAGTITGISGANGSGKSTFFQLLQGVHDDYDGQILINGIERREWSVSALQNIVATVPQSDEFFSGSFVENICMNGSFDEKWFKEVLEITGAGGILDAHGLGPADMLNRQGVSLSGGEKRKLSIARALYKRAPILLLDEPTSGIDHDSEIKIVQTIEWYKNRGNTIIIISHSDIALKICDNIVQFSK